MRSGALLCMLHGSACRRRNAPQNEEEENLKVKLQSPSQAVSENVLERIGDSVVYKVKSCCKIMMKKAFLGYGSHARLLSGFQFRKPRLSGGEFPVSHIIGSEMQFHMLESFTWTFFFWL